MLDGDDGFGRRKLVQRTAAERAAIVAETYEPRATVAGVAARHGIQPSQLSAWRSAARKRADVCKGTEPPLGFAEVAVVPEPVLPQHDGSRKAELTIELLAIELYIYTEPSA